MKTTPIKLHMTREQVKPFAMDDYKDVTHEDLAALGVTADFDHAGVKMAKRISAVQKLLQVDMYIFNVTCEILLFCFL